MSQEQIPPGAPPAPQPPQLQVQIPENHFDVLYSDQAFVAFSPVGFTLDFAQLTVPMNLSRVVARIGLSPVHLKLLAQVLQQNVLAYEQNFGEIQVHQQMQDHLQSPIGFRPQPGTPVR